METFSLRYRYKHKPPDCFSCVPPDTYGERFYEFLARNLFIQAREFPQSEVERPLTASHNGPLLSRQARRRE